MTLQEIFDKAVARLRDGTGRAMGRSGCQYYMGKGKPRCAIGALLSEGLAQDIENAGFGAISNITSPKYYGLFRDVEGELGMDINLRRLQALQSLQNIHDTPENWYGERFNPTGEKRLKDIAAHYGLTYTAPGEA